MVLKHGKWRRSYKTIWMRLLMCVKIISWKTHPTKEQIYGDLPPITTTVAHQRAIFAGHCYHAKDQVISDILLWQLPQSTRGTRPHTNPDTISRDTGLVFEELGAAKISTPVEGWWWTMLLGYLKLLKWWVCVTPCHCGVNFRQFVVLCRFQSTRDNGKMCHMQQTFYKMLFIPIIKDVSVFSVTWGLLND